MISDDDLDALDALEARCSPTPWAYKHQPINDLHWGAMPSNVVYRGEGRTDEKMFYVSGAPDPDFELIAAMRNLLPQLTAELRALKTDLEDCAFDRDRFQQAHTGACVTMVEMYAAATGNTESGPKQGVVEDLKRVRWEREQFREALMSVAPNVVDAIETS